MKAWASPVLVPGPAPILSAPRAASVAAVVRQLAVGSGEGLDPVPSVASRRIEPLPPAGRLLSHLQRSGVFQDYQCAFETFSGLPLMLRPAGTFQSVLHDSRRSNRFCVLLARNEKSRSPRLQWQQRLEEAGAHHPATLECFGELSETVVPVRSGDRLLGYLQTGQVFLRPPGRRRLQSALRELGIAPGEPGTAELESAYFHSRVISRKAYAAMLRLLAIFAEHLGAVSSQIMVRAATNELPSMTKAREFIAAHLNRNLQLDEVARAVNMSVFYFCKVFKQATRLTFTDYRARVRIEAVKAMLLNPYIRVTEAAFAAGFQSLSQFNRSFQRIEGESPTNYRHRLPSSPAPEPGALTTAA